MPNGQQKLLSAEEFAAKVKAKYPDYAHVPDQELTTKILAKYPEYSEKVMAPGVAEARTAIQGPLMSAQIAPHEKLPRGVISTEEIPPGQRPYAEGIMTGAAEAVGASVGGRAVAGIKGLAKLPKIVQILSKAAGSGVGAGAAD